MMMMMMMMMMMITQLRNAVYGTLVQKLKDLQPKGAPSEVWPFYAARPAKAISKSLLTIVANTILDSLIPFLLIRYTGPRRSYIFEGPK